MKLVPWEIEAFGRHIPKGTSERIICPKCSGGSDNEKSLDLYVDEAFEFHWRCWRSTCGYKGGKSTTGQPIVKPKQPPRHYTRPTKYPTEDQHALIRDKFGLPEPLVDAYSKEDDRFILTVRSPNQFRRGVVAYSFSGGKPKSLTYNEKPEEPFIHYAMPREPKALVVVEDWFSAEKVAEAGACGIAIQGTNLTQQMVTEITKWAQLNKAITYIALDLDAYAKALTYQLKYREQFPYGLKVWKLKVDLKYESLERIGDALDERITDFSGNYGEQGSL